MLETAPAQTQSQARDAAPSAGVSLDQVHAAGALRLPGFGGRHGRSPFATAFTSAIALVVSNTLRLLPGLFPGGSVRSALGAPLQLSGGIIHAAEAAGTAVSCTSSKVAGAIKSLHG